jgi:hypothetical protein
MIFKTLMDNYFGYVPVNRDESICRRLIFYLKKTYISDYL